MAGAPIPLYRNGIGDECVYVERGRARVETVFGAFEVGEGDYVIIPGPPPTAGCRSGRPRTRCAPYCIEAQQPHRAAEALPVRKYGQLLEHAPYCERDLRVPRGPLLAEDVAEADADTEVYIKHRGDGPERRHRRHGLHVLPFHPFDVVGWDGCLYPYAFNVADYEPITGRIHQPPPAHQVFEGYNFVVCNFVPRKVDYHPLSIPVPYYHSNVDSDEVMFYVDGDYEARKGSRHRQGLDLAAPGWPRPRPAAGRRRARIGKRVLRRARRHGRHLPPARARRGRARQRRRCVRRQLEPQPRLRVEEQAPQPGEGEGEGAGAAKVVTLCGSTRFEAEFAEVNRRLTMQGCVVLSLGMFTLPDLPGYDWAIDTSDIRGRLGAVHFQKIRMADEVYVVDPGGYLGESTRREIAYAESLGTPVRYLSRERPAHTGDGHPE